MKTCYTLFSMTNVYFLKKFLEIFLIYLKVNIPRGYIKLSPISRTIIPHRTPDGHLTKTGYVKLSAFSQVAKNCHQLESYLSEVRMLNYQLCFSSKIYILSVPFDRLQLPIWQIQFMNWKVKEHTHTYLICGTIQ